MNNIINKLLIVLFIISIFYIYLDYFPRRNISNFLYLTKQNYKVIAHPISATDLGKLRNYYSTIKKNEFQEPEITFTRVSLYTYQVNMEAIKYDRFNNVINVYGGWMIFELSNSMSVKRVEVVGDFK